jgi:hypothetical protein
MGRKCYKYKRYYNLMDRMRFLVFVSIAAHIVKLRLWILPGRIFCDNGLVCVCVCVCVCVSTLF